MMDFSEIVTLIVRSVETGSIYALVGLAMGIIYKASEVPNFAQGEMATFSTFIAFMVLTVHGAPFYVAFVVSLLFAYILGIAFEFLCVRRAKNPTILSMIILTIGLQMVLYGLSGWVFGTEQRAFRLPFSQFETVEIGGVVISHLGLATIIASFVLMCLIYWFLEHTKTGLAMRASQQNSMAARINGISSNRVVNLSFGISSIVGAIAAMLFAPIITLSPDLMWDPLLKGFAAAVLGGFASLPGIVFGGYILALIENLFGLWFSLEYKSVVAMGIIVLVLYIKPSGLFSKHYQRKV